MSRTRDVDRGGRSISMVMLIRLTELSLELHTPDATPSSKNLFLKRDHFADVSRGAITIAIIPQTVMNR